MSPPSLTRNGIAVPFFCFSLTTQGQFQFHNGPNLKVNVKKNIFKISSVMVKVYGIKEKIPIPNFLFLKYNFFEGYLYNKYQQVP